MTNPKCVFCRIAIGEIPSVKIYEDEVVFAFLDVNPVSDGHTLVVPKQHFDKLHDCPETVSAALVRSVGRIAKGVSEAMGVSSYNVLCNNGRAAGQVVEHLHFHIIPRCEGDDVFGRWPSYRYEKEKMEEIGNRIRRKL